MKELKFLSLFSGVGSPEMGLRDLGINYKLIGYSEIDERAKKSYCAIHEILDKGLDLGDITKIDIYSLPTDIDLIVGGSPCQDFSVSGYKLGADEGSGTRSSLMWNQVEIVRHCKPKYVLWENVKGVIQKNNIHNFNKYLDRMNEIGYNNYYKIMNGGDFGVAQDRDRMFVISIRKDIEQEFYFPKEYDYQVCLRDILENNVDERFYIKKILNPRKTKKYIQYDNSGKGHNSQQNRLYYLDGKMCTLPKCNGGDKTQVLLDEEAMLARKLTPYELWKLMGFSKEDYEKAANSGQTNGSLNNQAGNSIVLPLLKEIFKILLKDYLPDEN